MAWIERNGVRYYRIKKTIGHKTNDAGNIEAVCKEFFGRTKKEAEAKYHSYLEKEATGIDSKNQCFGIVADGWIEEFFLKDRKLKDSTKCLYLRAWNKYIRTLPLYHKPLDTISAKTIQSVYNELHKQGTTQAALKNIHKMMRRFFKYLEFEGLCKDCCRSVSIPAPDSDIEEHSVRIWDDEEVEKILSGFDKADYRFRLRFLIILAYYTGCREGELLALTYDDFSDDGLKITKQLTMAKIESYTNGKLTTALDLTSPKSKKSIRTVPLNPIVIEELNKHLQWHKAEQIKKGYRTKYVFTTDTGEFYDRHNIAHALNRYYKTIGVSCKGFHTYRHTFGTSLCKNGVPIQVASSLLGHDDISTTARYYVNIADNEKQAAVNGLMVVKNA